MKVLLYPFLDAPGIKKYMDIFEGWSLDNKAGIFVDPSDEEHKPMRLLIHAHGPHTVCVLGHCAVGGEYLRSEESFQRKDTLPVQGHTLTAKKLIDVFKALGMPDNATTMVKCLNCHSGQHFDGDGVFDEAAFATRLKKAMIGDGYGSVQVAAYVGAMTLMPGPRGDLGVPHRKFALMDTAEGKKAFRGKALRYLVSGNEATDKQTAGNLMESIKSFKGDTGIKL